MLIYRCGNLILDVDGTLDAIFFIVLYTKDFSACKEYLFSF